MKIHSLLRKSLMTTVVLISSINASYALPNRISSPLYSQTINYPNRSHHGWYFYIDSAYLNCTTCQNVNIKPDSITINFPAPRSPETGTIGLSILLKSPEEKIACEYRSEIPFIIKPTGEFIINSPSYPSRLTGSNSSGCELINLPVIQVLKNNDIILRVNDVSASAN